MTTILGIEDDDGFTIAADTQTTSDDRPFKHRDIRKIRSGNGYTVAGAGVSRYVDIIISNLECLTQPPSGAGYDFVVRTVVPDIRKLHEETGYTLKESEGFEFLLGVNKKLYYIAEDYSVIRSDSKVYSLGSGGKIALGAYMAGAPIGKAISIAMKNDIYSGGLIQTVKG